jgi:hypothetical protein
MFNFGPNAWINKIMLNKNTIEEKHVRKPKIWKNDTHSVRMV